MFDLDEYLIIVNNTLKKYLTDPIFNKCDFIKIHWLIPSDNNLVHYDNRTLLERFKGPYINSLHIKSIIRGHINNLKYWVHSPSYSPQRNITCNNAGEEIKYKKNMNFQSVKPFNKKKSYIIHFLFKSTEEYINKYKRGYSNWFHNDLNKWVLNYLKNIMISFLSSNDKSIQDGLLPVIYKSLDFNESEVKMVQEGRNKNGYGILSYFKSLIFFTNIEYN